MTSLGGKTPVSCLQEYAVSKQMIVEYKLVHNEVGTHNPLFAYRVQLGSVSEEASGRSKREAKHKAAEKLLKSLKVISSSTEEEEENEQEKNENFVGQLKEHCILNCYPEPKYELEEAAGPAHSRIFRMICFVSQLQDFGVGTTIKQAKQVAALKMLKRLKEFKGNDTSDKNKDVKNKSIPNNEEIIEKYNSLRPSMANPAVIKKEPAVFYKDQHKAYIGLEETSPTLLKLTNGTVTHNLENSLSLVEDIAKEMEVTITASQTLGTEVGSKFVILSMSVFPPLAGIGSDKQNAACSLLNSLLFLCKT